MTFKIIDRCDNFYDVENDAGEIVNDVRLASVYAAMKFVERQRNFTFPIKLADGTELTEQGANCYFLSPGKLFQRLELPDGPVLLHRPWHLTPMRLERI